MIHFVIKRLLMLIPMLFVISLVSFLIIQLPPGDYLTAYVARLSSTGERIDEAELENLRVRFGLDQPVYVQYAKWIGGIILRGDFGRSFQYRAPVTWLLSERTVLTIVLSALALVLTWIVAFPIGIYSAVRQYSIGDYVATFFGFVGMATPSFLVALIVLYLLFRFGNTTVSGLFSPGFENAPWNLAKVVDLMKHIWLPAAILGIGGTAGLIRTMRANLLDEMHKPYVTTARAYGFSERTVILRFPVRVALNPFISGIGWSLAYLVSGSVIVAIVFNMQTVGPIFHIALLGQDMYLAGAIVFMLSAMTVVGTLISDLLLAWVDPRIRFQ